MSGLQSYGFGDLVEAIAKKAEAHQPHDDADYVNPEDGLLYCGKCHTRKQCRVTLPTIASRAGKTITPPVECTCEKERQAGLKRLREQEEEMELVRRLRKNSLMDEHFSTMNFGGFDETAENATALKYCRNYAKDFEILQQSPERKNKGFLFWGEPGTGKTFAAACVANALLSKKISVVMTSMVKIMAIQERDLEHTLNTMNKAKLLVLDDLGAERGTDFALERVYNVIDTRYRSKLPMIITTNLNLKAMLTETDIRYNRVYDRIFEVCTPVHFRGESRRKRAAARRFLTIEDVLGEKNT